MKKATLGCLERHYGLLHAFGRCTRRARNSRCIPLECELVGARASTMSIGPTELSLDRIHVAFMIDIDQVAGRIPLRRANVELAENLERPSIQNVDVW
jgi:hypothetical protein